MLLTSRVVAVSIIFSIRFNSTHNNNIKSYLVQTLEDKYLPNTYTPIVSCKYIACSLSQLRTCNSCNKGTSADISGNARVSVLQLLCNTSSNTALFISLRIQFDYGLQC